MKAVIKHNGIEIPNSMCLVNTADNIATLDVTFGPSMKLDMDRVYVEVNVFGELVALDEDED